MDEPGRFHVLDRMAEEKTLERKSLQLVPHLLEFLTESFEYSSIGIDVRRVGELYFYSVGK